MVFLIVLLWSMSFGVALLFQAGLLRSALDATALMLSSLVVGYILTIFYENRRYRTYINWMQIQKRETECKGV